MIASRRRTRPSMNRACSASDHGVLCDGRCTEDDDDEDDDDAAEPPCGGVLGFLDSTWLARQPKRARKAHTHTHSLTYPTAPTWSDRTVARTLESPRRSWPCRGAPRCACSSCRTWRTHHARPCSRAPMPPSAPHRPFARIIESMDGAAYSSSATVHTTASGCLEVESIVRRECVSE